MPAPVIVSSVSRQIAVADLARTVAFYREVLGFELQGGMASPQAPVNLVRGPARIIAQAGDATVDSTGGHQPRGSAILFFQTDNLEALHAEVLSRKGKPSPLEKANWLKMRLFEIRDPDGHTLWFGQSYHIDVEPRHIPEGKGQLRQMLPQLPLNDVAAGVAYYSDALGFSINYQQGDLAVMYRDSVTLLLIARTEKHQGIGSCSVYIGDANELHAELSARGARVQGTPVSYPWGLRAFDVEDPEGNRITFSQPFE